jgi:hypothetical protein
MLTKARTAPAEFGRRYSISKSSVLRLVRQAGGRVRDSRFGKADVAGWLNFMRQAQYKLKLRIV